MVGMNLRSVKHSGEVDLILILRSCKHNLSKEKHCRGGSALGSVWSPSSSPLQTREVPLGKTPQAKPRARAAPDPHWARSRRGGRVSPEGCDC